MGRPKAEIDFETFEELCKIQCTQSEICSVLKVTDKTLNRILKEQYGGGFSECFKRLSEDGKTSLRRTQFELAKKSPAMAIFLGKNLLGQKDNPGEMSEEKYKDLDDKLNKFFEAMQ